MIRPERLSPKKGDILAALFVALLAAAVALCFLPGKGAGDAAEIYLDGRLIRTVSLETPQEFEITGEYTASITVSGGEIAITASGCPGGDCVRTGSISNPGRSIVCLPNRLEIRIPEGENGLDAVVR